MAIFPATDDNFDESNHAWYQEADDDVPMGAPVNAPTQASGNREGREHRKKAIITRYKESIKADTKESERQVANKQTREPCRIGSQSHPRALQDAVSDSEYQASDGTTEDDDDKVNAMIENSEFAASITSKSNSQTSAKGKRQTQKRKRSRSPQAPSSGPSTIAKKSRPVTMGEVEGEGEDAPSGNPDTTLSPLGRKRNPIYYFYEEVPLGADGKTAEGSQHFKCWHGNRKVLTVTRTMKFSVHGLVGHLKRHFPSMYRLYELFKVRPGPPTQDELYIASARKKLDVGPTTRAYVPQPEKASESIIGAFQRQAAGKFDQEVFEKLLAEWIVACDQPFDAVDEGPFRKLLQYTHRPSGKPLHTPHRTAIRTRVMKMGEEAVDSIKRMFSELESQVSISLDAWTSSNRYAFMVIVAHYITNEGELEEMLIDFCDLVGDHSGENMAEAVWQTLETYGLLGRVIAFVMDNASNNDTMVTEFEARCQERGIDFSASHSRLRCMPHTCHLATLKLLERIGVISKSDSKKASARGGGYQDAVTAPLSRSYDGGGIVEDKELDDEEMAGEDLMDNVGKVAPKAVAVNKLRRLIRAIQSSPQRRQAWLRHAALHQQIKADDLKKTLMLILDVPTRWSSTHQMLRRALDCREAIGVFLAQNRDLCDYELSEHEWKGVILVTEWLKTFRSAAIQMSTMKRSMVSSTHAIFRGLQDEIKSYLSDLSGSTSPQLILGLTAAHTKLSDFYYKFDESPLYTWASLLDPRISYDGMKLDCEDDVSLTEYLESAKLSLHTYFTSNYAGKHATPSHASFAHSSTAMAQSSFTARYRKAPRASVNELEEYFKLPREDFETCNPIKWWLARRSQFPNLFLLARDLLAIPGSAVAVERIFPGGRDTISLRRASLQPETIRMLMLVKQHLHHTRRVIDISGHK